MNPLSTEIAETAMTILGDVAPRRTQYIKHLSEPY